MQRKFLTNLGLLLFLNLLVKPIWIFGIDLNVQRIVGVGDYGFYSVILNFSFLFNILLDVGITNFNNRNIAQNNHLLNKHFSGLLVMKLLLGLVYVSITFLVALILRYNADQLKLLAWLALNQFLLSFILYLRSNISGFLMFKTESVLSVLDRLLMIFFCGALLSGHFTGARFRIEWFVYCQTAAYLITALIAFAIVVKKARFKKLSWNWPFSLMIMKQSFPFALLVLLMTFYNRLDPVMLESLLPKKMGNEQAGIYASGFRLLDAANMIAYLFSVLLIPIFSKMIKKHQAVDQMLKLSFTLIFTLAVIVSCGSFFYSFDIMNLLYKTHIQQSTNVFQLLILGFLAVSSTYIFGTLLTVNGNLKQLNILAFSGLLINLTLNFILIPRFMAVGSAVSSLATQFTTAIVQVILVQRVFKFTINYKYLLTLLLFFIGVICFNMLSRVYYIDWSFLSAGKDWLGNFSLMILSSILLAFLLRLWSFSSIINIFRQER
ncbi:MAG: oligosaccharide flippase family protein [Bacteroidales bacterium]|nr:oligosaccharide flippase family protein [Bacteroidales bacterium]MDD4604043.1 oligosaccharide flippase family protein [Bacteroidales bacterium]